MARTTKRLYKGVVPAGATAVYTAPGNTRATITRLHVVNNLGTSGGFYLYINTGGTPSDGDWVYVAGNGATVGATTFFDSYGPITINPTESIYMYCTASANLAVIINGYEEST